MPEQSGTGELVTGSRCPLCSAPLEYNGTYWCSQGTCRYAMPAKEPGRRHSRRDRHAFNVAYLALMEQHGREPDLRALYRDHAGQVI